MRGGAQCAPSTSDTAYRFEIQPGDYELCSEQVKGNDQRQQWRPSPLSPADLICPLDEVQLIIMDGRRIRALYFCDNDGFVRFSAA